jgi:membrane protein required for colicin V production
MESWWPPWCASSWQQKAKGSCVSVFDLVLLVLLLLGAFKGFRRGLLLEVVGILAFVLAIYVGARFLEEGKALVAAFSSIQEEYLPYAAFLLLFVLVVVGLQLLGFVLKKVLDMTLLGTFDNLAGALLGILKFAFGLSLLFWLLSRLGIALPLEWTEGSSIYAYIQPVAPFVVELAASWLPFFQELWQQPGA